MKSRGGGGGMGVLFASVFRSDTKSGGGGGGSACHTMIR